MQSQTSSQRPKFLRSFLDEIAKETDERGWIALFPYVLIGTVVVSAAVAYLVPDDFWSDARWDVSTAVYAGLLTFDGLILALGWNAFARTYDVLLRGDFGKYLMRSDLLKDYLVHITYMHIFQIFAVLAAAVGLMVVLVQNFPLWADRVILAAALALTMYSIKQAISAVTMMNDLVWQSAYFEVRPQNEGNRNVIPLVDR